jgi:hypothetical protein
MSIITLAVNKGRKVAVIYGSVSYLCFSRNCSHNPYRRKLHSVHIVTCRRDSLLRFGLDIGFIDHFNTQLVITLIIAPSLISTLHKSLAHTKSSRSFLDVSW